MRRRDIITFLGITAAWPLAAHAQQPSMPVIGFLSGASPDGHAHRVASFREGLKEAGYVEGRNVAIEFRWAEGRYDLLPHLAAELVDRRVAVLVATGGSASAKAAKDATSAIPVVFTAGGDPVGLGLVSSLNRPGGNVTGVALLTAELAVKRFEVLRELIPGARIVGVLAKPDSATGERDARAIQAAATEQGVPIHIVGASRGADFEAAFGTLVGAGVGALLVGSDAFFESRRAQLAGLAARHALPAIYDTRDYVEAGGLVSYGTDFGRAYYQAGVYAGRILGGATPADLPVVQLRDIELVVNLKTAKSLGLSIPQSILARADEVIE
ncbi:putative ABC transport system substrate-binding protein [Rhizobiales bacterium GAS191]|nr:putative ABC transport system substrate-binding protein [Rhizobiales bacterium GAS191]